MRPGYLVPILLLIAAAPANLSVYAGKSVGEPVGGVTFFKHPAVLKATAAAVGSPALAAMMLKPTGPSGLIEATATGVKGDGCQAHNCGDHHWTIEVAKTGASATVCYHDAKTMGGKSRWFVPGKPAALRPGGCFPTG